VKRRITIALSGNPNRGKTAAFNALTGARQHIANCPGVTVCVYQSGSALGIGL
jgi:ferrous iron transport protein B